MYRFESRVRYSEVDSEKKLTLSSLLDYLQDCCTFQSEELGIGVEYLAGHQAAWVLSSWEIEILRYPEMGERIVTGTWPYDFKGFFGYRNFLIQGDGGEVLARANSVWVYMDLLRMRPARIPQEMQRIYMEQFGEALHGDWGGRRLPVPQDGIRQPAIAVAKSQIDTNHHMNNSRYVLAAEEYLPDGFVTARLCVEYKKAAVRGDRMIPVVTAEGNTVTVRLLDETETPYAVVRFCGQGVIPAPNTAGYLADR
ncbi:MAG: acyl-[acyl-carrier-protein] thioesterase [Roseburia sp.]|jgi:medium-chain acyl-[acyl-carrier-protein] hydrolase|nr:acyl-[acyl-carrier-protein] thioesterase [Roseburia sp.]